MMRKYGKDKYRVFQNMVMIEVTSILLFYNTFQIIANVFLLTSGAVDIPRKIRYMHIGKLGPYFSNSGSY